VWCCAEMKKSMPTSTRCPRAIEVGVARTSEGPWSGRRASGVRGAVVGSSSNASTVVNGWPTTTTTTTTTTTQQQQQRTKGRRHHLVEINVGGNGVKPTRAGDSIPGVSSDACAREGARTSGSAC